MIGIVGGSGDFGQGLAGRLRADRHEVVIGSRTPRDEFVANAEAASARTSSSCPSAGGVERTDARARSRSGRQDRRQRGERPSSSATGGRRRAGRDVAGRDRRARGARGPSRCRLHTVSAKAARRSRPGARRGRPPLRRRRRGEGGRRGIAGALVEGRAVDAGPLEVARWLETAHRRPPQRQPPAPHEHGIRITGLPESGSRSCRSTGSPRCGQGDDLAALLGDAVERRAG